MTSRLPDPKLFCSERAKLHQTSVPPIGKFGCHITTTRGKIPQYVEWNSSCEPMFIKILSDQLSLDLEINKPWKGLDTAPAVYPAAVS